MTGWRGFGRWFSNKKASWNAATGEVRGRPDVIVYTMGKVGSSTVSASVNAAGLYCLDVHFIAARRIANNVKGHLGKPSPETIPKHVFESLRAHNAIVEAREPVKIITLIRHPVARNISAVFQNLPDTTEYQEGAMLERLKSYNIKIPDHWFALDFAPVTGIDVFAEAVDREAKVYRFANKRFDVLLLKLEASDSDKEAAISEFVGRKVKLVRMNEAKDKWYADAYAKVKSNPSLIRETFEEECLNLRYYRHFYTPADGCLKGESS